MGRILPFIVAGLIAQSTCTKCDVRIYRESFDSSSPPLLPPGWISSQFRTGGQTDFFTTGSSSRSAPNAIQCTNATVAQWILSPPIGGSHQAVASISFWTRRSSTFGASLVLEYAPDDVNPTFAVLGDTIRFSGSTLYEFYDVSLPASVRMQSPIRFRWRIIPSTSGATGTFRIDDIEVNGECALDIACGPVFVEPGLSSGPSLRRVRTRIRNSGLDNVSGINLAILMRTEADSILRPAREIYSMTVPGPLLPSDSLWVEFSLSFGPPGGTLIAVTSCPGDQNAANDSATLSLEISYLPGTLIVNEIMFAPESHEPEWVEIQNMSGDTLSLGQWRITDSDRETKHLVSKTPLIVPPSGLGILTDDSSGMRTAFGQIGCPVVQIPGFPSLNNDEDMIVISDHTGATIDSVAYRAAWHNPALVSTTGRSLERIGPFLPSTDPRSWTSSTSLQGGTPGRQNSVFAASANRRQGLQCVPNPFSPDNDGVDDVAVIRYTIPLPVAAISAFVYDVRGRRIRRLADHDPGSSQGVLIWDGRRDDGVRAPVGMYVVVFRAVQGDGGSLYETRCVVVLALKL